MRERKKYQQYSEINYNKKVGKHDRKNTKSRYLLAAWDVRRVVGVNVGGNFISRICLSAFVF